MNDSERQARIDFIEQARNNGLKWQEICTKLNLSDDTIYSFVSRYAPHLLARNHPPKSPNKQQQDRLHRINELRNKGLSWLAIGNELGISEQTTMRFVQRFMPELLHSKGLNAVQIERLQQIEQWRRNGLTWQAISSQLGMTKQAVHKFVKRYKPELAEL